MPSVYHEVRGKDPKRVCRGTDGECARVMRSQHVAAIKDGCLVSGVWNDWVAHKDGALAFGYFINEINNPDPTGGPYDEKSGSRMAGA